MTMRDRIIHDLDKAKGRANKINIGWSAWNELRFDPLTMHELALVDDKLFFKGVEIDPLCNFADDSFEVLVPVE